ncbi:trehalose-6-phosphate synthase [Thioclava nitratireducens]|uniref:Trehalose-6-phosphate synthase n=1 Tax=Thioclava nitratireducens TaxID=1915078 RepID=A0ABM6IF68_9RHOB|nr:trehalose-6-phosphate synthase [Thioclava nitratireducens]AQS47424.1 trehalose-6-phosphate synthase [Thioclava nitratireducens]
MPARLIVVSNRIPSEATPSGGLVVALHEALREKGGIWIGAHPEVGSEEPALIDMGGTQYDKLAFRLTEEDREAYYLGFANSVLWPIAHHRTDLVEINRSFDEGYLRVNRRIAQQMAEVISPEDHIWIHDYHFFPLAEELRSLGVTNRIGFFLHIPFPNITDLDVLPDPPAFARWLAHYDLVGLQTRADVARCLEMFRADPRAEMLPDGAIKFGAQEVSVRSFPIGISAESFARAAQDCAPPPAHELFGDAYVIGVDRLDYSKGLPQRFRAFERYLESYDTGPRASLVQIAPPSRESVRAYQEITADLQQIAGQVNGRFGEVHWAPIRFLHRPVPRDEIAGLLRGARAALVTPLADGMNLVAKEYVAAQDPEDPGVLVLSRFAGAAEDMTEALLVNPHDVDETAAAIRRALTMPLEERQARHTACLKVVEATDTRIWARSFLNRLAACTPALRITGRAAEWLRDEEEGREFDPGAHRSISKEEV